MTEKYILSVFLLLGILFIASNVNQPNQREGFDGSIFSLGGGKHKSGKKFQCPTRLVKHQGKFYMKTPNQTFVFNDLQEYIYFVKASRHKGVRCPILYAETLEDTQGNTSIRKIDDPETTTTGLMQQSADSVVKTEDGLSSDCSRKNKLRELAEKSGVDDDDGMTGIKPYDPENQEQGLPDRRLSKLNAMNPDWIGKNKM